VPKWAGGMWVIGVSLEACKEHFTRNYLQISKIGAVLRILDVYPGSDFFTSRILDPNCLLKSGFYALENMIRVVHPGSGCRLFTHSRSRGQKGTGFRIPDFGSAKLEWSVKLKFCIEPDL
jgi:hypothetical protein